jgi:hypothetical protein
MTRQAPGKSARHALQPVAACAIVSRHERKFVCESADEWEGASRNATDSPST